jgi:hypothetical protein
VLREHDARLCVPQHPEEQAAERHGEEGDVHRVRPLAGREAEADDGAQHPEAEEHRVDDATDGVEAAQQEPDRAEQEADDELDHGLGRRARQHREPTEQLQHGAEHRERSDALDVRLRGEVRVANRLELGLRPVRRQDRRPLGDGRRVRIRRRRAHGRGR